MSPLMNPGCTEWVPLLDKLQFSSNVDKLLQNVKVRVRKDVFRLGEKSKDVIASCRGVQSDTSSSAWCTNQHTTACSCGEDDVLSSCLVSLDFSNHVSPLQHLVRSLANSLASSFGSERWSCLAMTTIIWDDLNRMMDGMRDLSYFTACQAFLSLAFGVELPCALACAANVLLFVITAGSDDFQCVSDNCA